MNFWLNAFGLGGVSIEAEFYHDFAHSVETGVKRSLSAQGVRASDCGSSTETFSISAAEAIERIKQGIAEKDAKTH